MGMNLLGRWKPWIVVVLMVAAYALIKWSPEGSALWKGGIVLGVSLGVAYAVGQLWRILRV